MTNTELQTAINDAYNMLASGDLDEYETRELKKHYVALLREQQKRAGRV